MSMGGVEAIASSGSKWNDGKTNNIRDLFYNTLRNAEFLIQISTYSLGHDTDELNEFFAIMEERLKSNRKVNIIVNDDGKKNGTCTEFARKKMRYLQNAYPEENDMGFLVQYFKSTPTKILHAKLTVVDRITALVGSANISKNALISNYEIMLKVGKPAAGVFSLMLEDLSKNLRLGNNGF